ncbi:MAG: hypothetical protein ACYCS8_02015 [Acidithiobacillus sp.]|jgi:hypothetical protein
MTHDYGYQHRQKLIAQGRTELELEMRANWRLWLQVTWRRLMRGNWKHAYTSGTLAQKTVLSRKRCFGRFSA